jgi:hypothetical protein
LVYTIPLAVNDSIGRADAACYPTRAPRRYRERSLPVDNFDAEVAKFPSLEAIRGAKPGGLA